MKNTKKLSQIKHEVRSIEKCIDSKRLKKEFIRRRILVILFQKNYLNSK